MCSIQRGKSRNATIQQVEDVGKVSQRAKAGYFEEFSGHPEEQNSIMSHEMMDRRVDRSLAE